MKYYLTDQVLKFDDDLQQVFGMANLSVSSDGEVVKDLQDDVIAPEDLEKAAYEFVLEFRDTGVMHQGVAKGRLIESYFASPEKMRGLLKSLGVAENLTSQVEKSMGIGWWIGFQIDDPDVFKRVKSGELKMFSIEGSAQRVPV